MAVLLIPFSVLKLTKQVSSANPQLGVVDLQMSFSVLKLFYT